MSYEKDFIKSQSFDEFQIKLSTHTSPYRLFYQSVLTSLFQIYITQNRLFNVEIFSGLVTLYLSYTYRLVNLCLKIPMKHCVQTLRCNLNMAA